MHEASAIRARSAVLVARVVRRAAGVEPWRYGLGDADAVHAVELPVGRLRETGKVTGAHPNWS